MREEFVQNAINFLKHPKVVSSSDIQRRSFLEKKGLTNDEIDEAFQRCSVASSNGMCAGESASYQGSGFNLETTILGKEAYTDKMAHSGNVISTAPPEEPNKPPHSKSYMEIIEMIQRGEMPSNIKEIDDSPPNPYQPLSKPRLAPRPKPWEATENQSSKHDHASDVECNAERPPPELSNSEWQHSSSETHKSEHSSAETQSSEQFEHDDTPPTDFLQNTGFA